MRAVASRVRPKWWSRVKDCAAVLAGTTLRNLPEAAGALLVSYGFALAWRPFGFMALGAFLLAAGRDS